jgi:hypothetical protein
MADDTPHCLNDHRHGPAVGETLYGMAGDDEIVGLLCAECLYAGRDE